ncbi:hypothetical protein [Aminipila luticellarii]|uniref:Uncharacterized protein n=1 Tax=Aminipila luticellarii TaxID=2507160 RepID=A0A410PXG5_9FIRM|nr:hypothetical protein [Aminipila luticellarii]QAT43584.1 hypothetical protein EQM06_10330 [Aminipila luticellarii]
MSILAIEEKSHVSEGFYGMAAASAFCLIFSAIYNHFGHGVHSFYMTYLYLCPLLLGMVFYGIFLFIFEVEDMSRFSFNVYNSGVAALTIGALLQGVLEIAGTASPYIIVYGILGGLMLAMGVVSYLFKLFFIYGDRHR